MKRIPRLKGPSIVPAIAGLAILTLGPSLRADDALDAAAAALAKAGGDYLRAAGVTPVRASTATSAEVGGKASTGGTVSPVAEPPFGGVFVGVLGPGEGNLRARFVGSRVEWVKVTKRSWESVTNDYTFTAAGGRLTVTRSGASPLVYRIGEGRKSLALESGDGNLVPKELQAAQP